jgi:parvulin-like peptidyl-prolyl isomerase
MIPRAPRRFHALLVSLVLTVAPAVAQEVRGVGEDQAPAAETAPPGSVLAIDGQAIPGEDYAAWLIEEIGTPHLKSFALDWEIARLAAERGIAADDAQVRAALELEIATRVQGAFRGVHEEWVAELARTGRSVEGHRVQRTAELQGWLNAFNMANDGRVVPEAKIERDWELFHGPRGRAFDLEMIKVLVVMQMPDEKGSPDANARAREQARSEGQEKAERLRAEIVAGADFATVARRSSDDEATRDNGGHVPRFVQFGWPSKFVDALFELERGELSEPIFARGGWWLVRVRDWKDTSLESVRAELTARQVELGAEQDEVGEIYSKVSATLEMRLEPGLYATDSSPDGEGPGAVAMTVNGRPVPRTAVARWLLHTRGEAAWGQFAEEWLLLREAQKQGVVVDEAEVEARVGEFFDSLLADSFDADRALWRASMESAGTDPEAWERRLRRRQRLVLLAEKLIRIERRITPEDVRLAYEQRYGTTGRRVEARALLLEVPTPPMENGISKEEADALLQGALEARKRDAEALRTRALSGEDFVTLVRQYSQDAVSKERDGVLEGGFRPDGWSSTVSAEVMALPRGAISKVVQEGRFVVLFEVLGFEEVSFESVREELARDLNERRIEPIEIAAFRNELLKAASVELLPDLRR